MFFFLFTACKLHPVVESLTVDKITVFKVFKEIYSDTLKVKYALTAHGGRHQLKHLCLLFVHVTNNKDTSNLTSNVF